MNKLLIVLLAVCLVSAHAFVKRDAPAAENSAPSLDNLLKQGQDFINQVQATLKEQAGNLKKTAEQTFEDIKKKIDAGNKEAATGA